MNGDVGSSAYGGHPPSLLSLATALAATLTTALSLPLGLATALALPLLLLLPLLLGLALLLGSSSSLSLTTDLRTGLCRSCRTGKIHLNKTTT